RDPPPPEVKRGAMVPLGAPETDRVVHAVHPSRRPRSPCRRPGSFSRQKVPSGSAGVTARCARDRTSMRFFAGLRPRTSRPVRPRVLSLQGVVATRLVAAFAHLSPDAGHETARRPPREERREDHPAPVRLDPLPPHHPLVLPVL